MGKLDAIQGAIKGALGLLKPSAKPVVQATEELGPRYMTASPGVAKAGRVFTAGEINALRDELEWYAKPRVLSPERNKALTSILTDAQNPGVKTHVLYTGEDFTEPASVFQLQSEHDLADIGNYMPNLVALLGSKGTGTQALQEARRSGPYGLVSTPHSRPFYEKISDGRLPGFMKHPDKDLDGVAYQHKKKGGLVKGYAKGGLIKGGLTALVEALQNATRYKGYRGDNMKLAETTLARSKPTLIPSTDTRQVADSLNMAYANLAQMRVPKKLLVPRRSGSSIVTESDISRAMEEGSNAFGLRITPTDQLQRHDLSSTVGAHYAPPERVDQLKPFIKRYKNEGFTDPRITAVHHKIDGLLRTDDAAAETASVLATRLGSDFNKLFRQVAGGLPEQEQAALMTEILNKGGVDALVYDNWIEGAGRLDRPVLNWATKGLDPKTGYVTQDPRAPGVQGYTNPSVTATGKLNGLKRGGLVKMKECNCGR